MGKYDEFTANNIPSDEDMSSVSRLGIELYRAEKAVLQSEQDLKKAMEWRRHIQEKLLPEAMMTAGVLEIKILNGTKIELEKDGVFSVKVKKQNKQRVMNWLEKNDHGAIIQRTLSVAFSKDQEDQVDDLVKLLVNEKKLPAKEARDYSAATLKKLIKERRETGQPVPTDIIDVYAANRAKITEGKPKIIFDEDS